MREGFHDLSPFINIASGASTHAKNFTCDLVTLSCTSSSFHHRQNVPKLIVYGKDEAGVCRNVLMGDQVLHRNDGRKPASDLAHPLLRVVWRVYDRRR